MPNNAFLNGHMKSVGRKQRSIDITNLDQHMLQIKVMQGHMLESLSDSADCMRSNNRALESMLLMEKDLVKELFHRLDQQSLAQDNLVKKFSTSLRRAIAVSAALAVLLLASLLLV